jgi:Family of unknown function (DUF6232)
VTDRPLFESGDTSIFPNLARFGDTSYQIANLSLVRVGYARKLNPLAVIMFLIGMGAMVVAYNMAGPIEGTRIVVGLGGILLVLMATVCQAMWPAREFTFTLKTNSGDVFTFTTENRKLAYDIKDAIEQGFVARSTKWQVEDDLF